MDPFPKWRYVNLIKERFPPPTRIHWSLRLKISNLRVRRILVDTGISSDIMILECLNRLTHDPKTIEKIHYPVIDFGQRIIHPTWVISLSIRLGGRARGRKMNVDFLIVKDLKTYNVILGRPTLNRAKAVVVKLLILVKYVWDDGSIGTIHGDQQQARVCYLTTLNPTTWNKDVANTGVKRKHEEAALSVNVPSLGDLTTDTFPVKCQKSG